MKRMHGIVPAPAVDGDGKVSRDVRAPLGFAIILLLLSIAVISAATLTSRPGGGGSPQGCYFICGPRGLADTIANILLFAPFGLSLGLLRFSGWRGMLIGALFSVGIEAAQVWIVTGRDATPADVVSNSLGALLGASLGYRWFTLLLPGKRRARKLLLASAAGVVASAALTGWLLAPASQELAYYGQWTEGHGSYNLYRGEIISASIGDERVLPYETPVSQRAQELLANGVPLATTFRVGPAPYPEALLVAISRGASQLVFVTIDGQDVVARYFGKSLDLTLDGPSVRLVGGMTGFREGDEAMLRLRRIREGYCLELGQREACSGFTAGNGWSLIQNVAAYPPPASHLINAIWMAILGFPLGLWYRRDRVSTTIVAMTVGAILLMPLFGPLAMITAVDAAGALAGVASGYALRRWGRSRYGQEMTT